MCAVLPESVVVNSTVSCARVHHMLVSYSYSRCTWSTVLQSTNKTLSANADDLHVAVSSKKQSMVDEKVINV